MRESEGLFTEYLESMGKTWIYEPMRFHLSKSTYKPDFYCPDNDTFYEVSNTRQAFHSNKEKYERFIEEYPHIKFSIVRPSGELYASSQLVVVHKKNKTKEKKRKFTFYVFRDYFDKLQNIGEKNDCTVSLLINQAIDEFFDIDEGG